MKQYILNSLLFISAAISVHGVSERLWKPEQSDGAEFYRECFRE